MSQRVAIIGSGVTGLTCAFALAKKGFKVTVFEKSEHSGGLGATFRSNGFAFDHGPHEFCTTNPELVKLLKEVLGEDFLVCHKKSAQHFRNALVEYPLSPLDFIRRVSPALVLRVTIEVIWNRCKNLFYDSSDYTFRRWVASRFGPTLYRIYFEPYTRKVWGVDPDALDPSTASNRISFNSIFDLAIKTFQYLVLRMDDYSNIHSPLKSSFYYSRGGIGTLIDRLEKDCRKQGVQFRFGHSLEQIDLEGRRATRLHFTDTSAVDEFSYVVSTIPLTQLLSTLGQPIHMLPIRFRAMIFVFLEVPRRPVTPYSWIYYPEIDICFQRITEFSNFESSMAPKGASGLCLEISCFVDDAMWKSADSKIVKQAREDLEQVGVLDGEIDCQAHVVRVPFVYPIQVTGYQRIVCEALKPVRELSNLVSTGRQGLYKYCNMNECMEMAIDVAAQIEAGVGSFTYSLESRWKGAGQEEERASVSGKEGRL